MTSENPEKPIAMTVDHVDSANLAAPIPHSAMPHYVFIFLQSLRAHRTTRTGLRADRSGNRKVMEQPQIADPSTVLSISLQELFSWHFAPLHRQ